MRPGSLLSAGPTGRAARRPRCSSVLAASGRPWTSDPGSTLIEVLPAVVAHRRVVRRAVRRGPGAGGRSGAAGSRAARRCPARSLVVGGRGLDGGGRVNPAVGAPPADRCRSGDAARAGARRRGGRRRPGRGPPAGRAYRAGRGRPHRNAGRPAVLDGARVLGAGDPAGYRRPDGGTSGYAAELSAHAAGRGRAGHGDRGGRSDGSAGPWPGGAHASGLDRRERAGRGARCPAPPPAEPRRAGAPGRGGGRRPGRCQEPVRGRLGTGGGLPRPPPAACWWCSPCWVRR